MKLNQFFNKVLRWIKILKRYLEKETNKSLDSDMLIQKMKEKKDNIPISHMIYNSVV